MSNPLPEKPGAGFFYIVILAKWSFNGGQYDFMAAYFQE